MCIMGVRIDRRHSWDAVDLTTSYLGLKLAHPLVPGACPLTAELDSILRLEDAGAPAIVLHSLFEEQIAADPLRTERSPSDPVGYLEHVNRVKESVHIPVIASLNGTTDEGWTSFAGLVEQAGADALELNLYHCPRISGRAARRSRPTRSTRFGPYARSSRSRSP